MSQVDFFNSVAKNWDNMIEINESKINYLLSKLEIKKEDNILDIGTGTGVLIPFLVDKASKGSVKGVDISKGMLEVASEKFKHLSNVDFDLVNVEKDNIGCKYDKIILYSMYPHLEDKTNTIKKLVTNNLNKDGILMIAHSNSRDFLNNLHKKADESVSESRLIEVNKQKEVFINAGLNVTDAFENDEIYYLTIASN